MGRTGLEVFEVLRVVERGRAAQKKTEVSPSRKTDRTKELRKNRSIKPLGSASGKGLGRAKTPRVSHRTRTDRGRCEKGQVEKKNATLAAEKGTGCAKTRSFASRERMGGEKSRVFCPPKRTDQKPKTKIRNVVVRVSGSDG